MAQSSKIAERLLAHARLCRQIAEESWSEHVATGLVQLADECTSTAAELTAEDAENGDKPRVLPH